MSKYEVKDVVCDYGVFVDDKLKLILNSRRIALQIKFLLEEDEREHRRLSREGYEERKRGNTYGQNR